MISIKKALMIAIVIIIFIAFFLPWINVESAAVGGITKLLTGKKQALIDSISGFDVPILANSDESRFMISVIRIFAPGVKNAGAMSFLIWLVPGFSLAMLGLSTYFQKNKWVHVALGAFGVVIFSAASFVILTTDLDKLVMKVNIQYGIWILLLGYLAFGVLEIYSFFKVQLKKND
ncbi:MAG: hypothetical protein P9X22_05565 [Candidatus Zapsychrus exili]|nr:hypothetical protein [Candidatus Zapsychrus exili]